MSSTLIRPLCSVIQLLMYGISLSVQLSLFVVLVVVHFSEDVGEFMPGVSLYHVVEKSVGVLHSLQHVPCVVNQSSS